MPETSGESQSEQLATTSVDPSTGIAQTSIQFKAPKARGAAQPGVSLAYSSRPGAAVPLQRARDRRHQRGRSR
jgi:hypothetical protein